MYQAILLWKWIPAPSIVLTGPSSITYSSRPFCSLFLVPTTNFIIKKNTCSFSTVDGWYINRPHGSPNSWWQDIAQKINSIFSKQLVPYLQRQPIMPRLDTSQNVKYKIQQNLQCYLSFRIHRNELNGTDLLAIGVKRLKMLAFLKREQET
jgi:hypothetical protein